MKYKDRDELVQGLRDLADFLERPESVALPIEMYGHKIDQWIYNEDDQGRSAKENMKKIVKILGSCKKDYSSSMMLVTKEFGPVKLEFATSRDGVCTKRVVETKKVPKQRYVEIPGEFDEREVVEWDCDPILAPTQ
jgi:hypothetical protein